MGLSYFVSSLTLLRNYSGLRCMPPAAASEEKRVWLGDTPDPGRRLRLLHLRFSPLAAASEEKKDWLGPLHTAPQTAFPRPRQETAPPALPALDLTQRFSTTNMATAEPVPAVTFN